MHQSCRAAFDAKVKFLLFASLSLKRILLLTGLSSDQP
jgi:hypothetical protein